VYTYLDIWKYAGNIQNPILVHNESNTTGHVMTLQSSFGCTKMATNSGLKHVDFEQLKKQFSHIVRKKR